MIFLKIYASTATGLAIGAVYSSYKSKQSYNATAEQARLLTEFMLERDAKLNRAIRKGFEEAERKEKMWWPWRWFESSREG